MLCALVCVWLRSFCGSCLSGAGVCRLIPAGAAESSLPGNWCLTSVTRSLPSRWQQAPAWALPACAATLCACHVTFCAYLCPSDNERVKVCVNLGEGFACVLNGYHVLHRSDDIWSSVVCWDLIQCLHGESLLNRAAQISCLALGFFFVFLLFISSSFSPSTPLSLLLYWFLLSFRLSLQRPSNYVFYLTVSSSAVLLHV